MILITLLKRFLTGFNYLLKLGLIICCTCQLLRQAIRFHFITVISLPISFVKVSSGSEGSRLTAIRQIVVVSITSLYKLIVTK